MEHRILCSHCGTPVLTRQALEVAGHGLRPLHAHCYAAFSARQPWYRKPGWPVNRWRSFLPFNALLLGLVLLLHLAVTPIPAARVPGLVVLLLVVNAWMLLARLMSHLTLERHLPAQRGTSPGAGNDGQQRCAPDVARDVTAESKG